MNKSTYVYDIEVYPNFFMVCFKSIYNDDYIIFEISDRKNDQKELVLFLNKIGLQLIGFNNINFDYVILHETVLKYPSKKWLPIEFWKQCEQTIASEYSAIWSNQVKIPQLDLYLIKHYNNLNRSTSLKWLEFAMRSSDVRDLPFKVGTELTSEQMDEVISYCKHDVSETFKFFNLILPDIRLRLSLSKEYNLNLVNADDPKIGSEILLDLISKKMNIDKNILNKKRTYHKEIRFKDLILPYVKFKSSNLDNLLNKFNLFVSTINNNEFKYTEKIGNLLCDFGQGGIHGCIKSGIYTSSNDNIIVDIDVKSFYPNLAINNNIKPQHLGESFSEIYKSIYELRKTFPKKDPRNIACKLMLNGAFGKMNSQYSFLYDTKSLLGITLNGQLLLSMLMEDIDNSIEGITFLQANTDGFTLIINKDNENKLYNIVKKWEKLTNLEMEYAYYKKMIIRDVNSYIAIDNNDNIKFKGAFEIDRDYHKNHSKRIVPISLANYFINNVSCSDTIFNHFNGTKYNFAENYGIFDFCIGSKMKGQNELFKRDIIGFKVVDEPLARMNRYYVSNEGSELIKKLPPLDKNYITDTAKHPSNQMNIFDVIEDDTLVDPEDRETNIEAGFKCTIFNKYHAGDYDINYKYYIEECNKITKIFN